MMDMADNSLEQCPKVGQRPVPWISTSLATAISTQPLSQASRPCFFILTNLKHTANVINFHISQCVIKTLHNFNKTYLEINSAVLSPSTLHVYTRKCTIILIVIGDNTLTFVNSGNYTKKLLSDIISIFRKIRHSHVA